MIEVSSTIGDKAVRLYESGRVFVGHLPDGTPVASVRGDTDWRYVRSTPVGLQCSCRAWSPSRSCSHAAAASLAWADERIAGAGSEPPAASGAANRIAASPPGDPLTPGGETP